METSVSPWVEVRVAQRAAGSGGGGGAGGGGGGGGTTTRSLPASRASSRPASPRVPSRPPSPGRGRGGAVQVDPMKPKLKLPEPRHLQLELDELI